MTLPTLTPVERSRSRLLEDIGFLAGIVFVGTYVLGIRIGPAVVEGWVVVAITAMVVAPKTLGRATAGKIWDKLPFGGAK